MIQRIQSVFLFIVIVSMALYLAFPTWTSDPGSDGIIYRLYAFFLFTGTVDNPQAGSWLFWPYLISGVLAFLVIVNSIIEVLSYNKRMKQVKLGALNSLLLAVVLIYTVWLITTERELWLTVNPGNYAIGIVFPALAMISNFLANYFIRKDEKLVRSMDRIR